MSEITIMGCDGCQKAATARRPVHALAIDHPGTDTPTLKIDVHDYECVRRYFSRLNKEAKEAATAERAKAGGSPRRETAKK